MIFYNFNNINKYNSLKKRIKPRQSYPLKRFGQGDGSYVLEDKDWKNKNIRVLSYGVGSSIPFEENIANNYDSIIHCYDESIDYDSKHDNIIFKKEHLKDFGQFQKHFELIGGQDADINILKMDIEGCEWTFFDNADIKYFSNRFDYICIELHGLIEECPDGWVIEEQTQNAKNDMQLKLRVLDKLNILFDIIHIHGNNHSPRYFDMPDSLEITYKYRISFEDINNMAFPIDGLDEANFKEREDYTLDWWVDHHGNNRDLFRKEL